MRCFERGWSAVGAGTALVLMAVACASEVLIPGGSGGGGTGSDGSTTSGIVASSSSGPYSVSATGSVSSSGGAAPGSGPIGSGGAGGSTGVGGDGGADGLGGAGGRDGSGGRGAGWQPGIGGGGSGGASPTAGVACGEETCFEPGYCLLCDPTGNPRERGCGEGFGNECREWGRYPPLRMLCDDHGDCGDGDVCALFEGSLGTYTDCWEAPGCLENCEACFAKVACETLDDCPPCSTACMPHTDPDYPVSVCIR